MMEQKKILSGILSAVVVLCSASCGGNAEASGGSHLLKRIRECRKRDKVNLDTCAGITRMKGDDAYCICKKKNKEGCRIG